MSHKPSKIRHLLKSSLFQDYKKEIDNDIERILQKISRQKKPKSIYCENPLEEIEENIRSLIREKLNKEVPPSIVKLVVPPPEIEADYTIATFSIAKKFGVDPQQIAQKITEIIRDHKNIEEIKKIECIGPYINISINQKNLYGSFLNYISRFKKNYGKSYLNSGKIAVVDFSSPNIAKPLGIGHLRSTIIGHALANLYEFTGYTVIRDNHLGDWGTQFGELIYAYKKWGHDKIIKKNPIKELKNLYVKFHKESQINPQIKEDARIIFNQLENGDAQMLNLWKKFRDWSIADFKKIYKKIGVKFDIYIGESYFNNQVDVIINECLTQNLCTQDTHSALVLIENLDDLPSFLLRKQDGSSLYITRDLATLKHRVKTFKPDTILYVVGEEQSLNFRQLFAAAKKLEYLPINTEAKHISFGMVLKDGKKMSTRKGTIVELDEVLEKAVKKELEILQKNNPEMTAGEKGEIADIIGVGAVLYNDLKQSRTINISFDLDKMLKLEIGGSPYLQYVYTRINSILSKLTIEQKPRRPAEHIFENQKEFELAKKIMSFPNIINNAQLNDAPHLVCTYLEELAQQFNNFYSEVFILNTKNPQLLHSRVTLLNATAITLKNGLNLLGIKTPLKM